MVRSHPARLGIPTSTIRSACGQPPIQLEQAVGGSAQGEQENDATDVNAPKVEKSDANEEDSSKDADEKSDGGQDDDSKHSESREKKAEDKRQKKAENKK